MQVSINWPAMGHRMDGLMAHGRSIYEFGWVKYQ